MFFRSRSHAIIIYCAFALLLTLCSATTALAQGDDFGDDGADPIQLFRRGQDAHARGNYEQAISLYDAAIKVRPEFPEAFYQRGNALVSLGRIPEAEKSFQSAVELRANWPFPQAALGALYLRQNRFDEAEKYLERAIALDPENNIALISMADLRLRTKAKQPQLEDILKKISIATARENPTASLWAARASIERALGNKEDAQESVENALTLDAKNSAALMERAELEMAEGKFESAVRDAQAIRDQAPKSLEGTLFLAHVLGRAGRADEAIRLLDSLDNEKRRLPEVLEMRKQLSTPVEVAEEDRAALEKMLEEQPRNASLLSRLCVAYRTDNPERALEYCQRALEIQPTNPDYATSYGAALVRARRFQEAVQLLRQVIASVPDNYAAHANLATALYELKLFPEALVEYDWIIKSRPDMVIAYFFIGTAHDQLNQFPQALAAYEKFLERADPKVNQLEIDKVKLRLPSLRNQIRRGEGAKTKKGE
ncbi:MAG: tetratricopeptide repeat protein [Pyrinomonadaceae bacterium]|nr:tetratricopeptide repeat protein [Pyrinomonadaceae bacterium]